MNTKSITKELNDAAKEIEKIQIEEAAEKINGIADEIEELDMFDVTSKKASLINPGDKIVCLNPIQGIFKGRVYLAGEYIEHGILLVKEQTGEPVGIFNSSRFCVDYKTY